MGSEDGLEARRVRAAKNQALFRTVNERIDDLASVLVPGQTPGYVCECLDARCAEFIGISHREYERVREHPARFLITPSHEDLDVEVVVEKTDWYMVVEKIGEAGEVAAKLDPRAAKPT